LIPASHSDQITDLLAELHALNYFSLSFPDRPAMALGFKTSIEKKLAGDPSPRYRKALEYKLSMYVLPHLDSVTYAQSPVHS